MSQKWEVAQPSSSGSIPSLDSFVQLVMPSPSVDLREAASKDDALHTVPSDSVRIVDSPDDAFASCRPLRVRFIPDALVLPISDLIDIFRGHVEPTPGEVSTSAPLIRYGIARRRDDTDIAVWIEARDPETGAYYLPRKELVRDPSLRWGSLELEEVQAERFFEGPVRLLVTLNARDGTLGEVSPWVSSVAVAEAEEHFTRAIRTGDHVESSWVASEVFEQLSRQMPADYAGERSELPADMREQRLGGLGPGTIRSVSLDTAGHRVYTIDFNAKYRFTCIVLIEGDTEGALHIRATRFFR